MVTPERIAIAVVLASAILVLVLFVRPHLTVTRGGKILAFVGLLIIPGVAMMVSTTE